MTHWKTFELRISRHVRLARRPVAVAFLDAPPAGVERFSGTESSSCSFWRLASPPLGRPTCMAVPAALAKGTVASLGCIGNRAYTGLGDDELYVAVPGVDVPEIADALDVIASANAQLNRYAVGRREQLATE